MAFKTVLSVTGADHSDQDVRTAAGLCAEVGAHLSVRIIPAPMLVMSYPPNGVGVPEWPMGHGQAMANIERPVSANRWIYTGRGQTGKTLQRHPETAKSDVPFL